jgi:hypothetical protein
LDEINKGNPKSGIKSFNENEWKEKEKETETETETET